MHSDEAPLIQESVCGKSLNVPFLAAMSSSRSDDVTNAVCLSVTCFFFYFEAVKSFEARRLQGVSRVFQERFKSISRAFQERFKSVSRAFREGFKGVSRAYQGCVKGVSRGFRVFSSAQFQMGATSQKALNWSKIGATLRLKIRAKSELLSGGE